MLVPLCRECNNFAVQMFNGREQAVTRKIAYSHREDNVLKERDVTNWTDYVDASRRQPARFFVSARMDLIRCCWCRPL